MTGREREAILAQLTWIVDSAIALLRTEIRNDGAQGESVHIVCAEVERLRDELSEKAGELAAAEAALAVQTEELAEAMWRIGELKAERSKLARGLAGENAQSVDDWACARCVPASEVLVRGFVCARHLAEDIIAEAEGEKGGA